MKRRDLLKAPALLAIATAARGAVANTSAWPRQRPVRLILTQSSGSGPDVLARYMADELTRMWGQSVIVENRPGGQSVIGALAVARAPADGYTLYYATTAAIITNPLMFKSLPYHPVKDFAPVRLVGRSVFQIATSTTSTFRTFQDVLAQARSNPGRITIATQGSKTFPGILADMLAHQAGVKFNHIGYSKTTDALQDVMAGRVDLACLPDAAMTTFVKSGQMRLLAVSSKDRLADARNVPPLSEFFPDFEFTGWNGVFAPAGVEPRILEKINHSLEQLLSRPEVAQKMLELGSLVEPRMSIEQMDKFLLAERTRWANIAKTLRITPD